MPDVFISYSRKDKTFTQKLHEALIAKQREVWVDWEGIPLSADWWAEIRAGIESADTFIFIISPDSIISEVCQKEIAAAAACNKRIVPILYREVVAKEVPPEVASLNWIFVRESDDFEWAFASLVQTIDTDLEWVKAHTRLTIRAVEWDRWKRNASYLLQGDDLAEAEQRMAQQAHKEPKLSNLQGEYILASRQQATRRQRLIIGAITLGLVVSVVLALIALGQSRIARNAEATAIAEREIAWQAQGTAEASEQLAWHAVATAEAERNRAATAEANAYILRDKAQAEQAQANSRELALAALHNLTVDPELSILLALHGLSVAPTIEAEEALRQALLNSRVEQTYYDTIPLLDLGALQALAQSRLTRQLRPEECEKYLHLKMCP